jgi:RHS repeat-associated protein
MGFGGSATSGLYYYGYRFYDPYLQRWVNRDPIAEEGGINLYVYVHNSPLFFIDPHGLEKDRECLRECSQAFIADCMNGRGTVIGTLFGLGTYAVTDGVTTPTGRLKHFCWGGKLTRFGRAAAVGSFVGALELTYDNLPCIYGYLACIAGCPPQRFRCDFGTFWPSAYPDPLEPSCTFQNAPPTRLDILIPQVQL